MLLLFGQNLSESTGGNLSVTLPGAVTITVASPATITIVPDSPNSVTITPD